MMKPTNNDCPLVFLGRASHACLPSLRSANVLFILDYVGRLSNLHLTLDNVPREEVPMVSYYLYLSRGTRLSIAAYATPHVFDVALSFISQLQGYVVLDEWVNSKRMDRLRITSAS